MNQVHITFWYSNSDKFIHICMGYVFDYRTKVLGDAIHFICKSEYKEHKKIIDFFFPL